VISVVAFGFPHFLAVFGVLRGAGVDITPSGGNALSVPDDTDRELLRAVAAMGAQVGVDLAEPDPEPDPVTAPSAPSAAAVRKPTRRRTKE
jgi:hypothetical protein